MTTNLSSQSVVESQQKPTLLQTFPADVLLYIFDFAANHFDPRQQEPTIDVGDCSPWSMDLRMKKDLVRVCRNWRIVATRYLYHRIYLHRIGHLCALAKVLEESASGHDGGADYSSCVHHVHMQFYVHPSWEAVYFKSFVSLLKLCTSARSLSWRITWDGAGVDPVLARCSTLNFTLLSQPSLRSTLSSLQKLTLALDKPTHQDTISNNDVKATLTFDQP